MGPSKTKKEKSRGKKSRGTAPAMGGGEEIGKERGGTDAHPAPSDAAPGGGGAAAAPSDHGSVSPSPASPGGAGGRGGGGGGGPLPSYPYETDYCDHFETSPRAYRDVLPLLDLVAPVRSDRSSRNRADHILFDPYYCAGRSLRLLKSLGFDRTVHRKRDFYADVEGGTVPEHDALVTNPPYSGDHKERCVDFALKGLRGDGGGKGGGGRPFFLLMPNYVATKDYWRDRIGAKDGEGEPSDIAYVVPPAPYEYDHPEGTGHSTPPFASMWFCGIPPHLVSPAGALYRESAGVGPRLATSIRELQDWGAVPTAKRGNPRQRRKKRKRRLLEAERTVESGEMRATVEREGGHQRGEEGGQHEGKDKAVGSRAVAANETAAAAACGKRGKKKSRYRDESGVRKKKRF